MDPRASKVMLFIRGMNIDCGNEHAPIDPFFEICNESGFLLAQSAVYRNDKSPHWPPVKLAMELLCGCDSERKVTLSFYLWRKNGLHKLLGKVDTSMHALKLAADFYYSQDSIAYLDKKETYDFGKFGKIFVYDFIESARVQPDETFATKDAHDSYQCQGTVETDSTSEMSEFNTVTDSESQCLSLNGCENSLGDSRVLTPKQRQLSLISPRQNFNNWSKNHLSLHEAEERGVSMAKLETTDCAFDDEYLKASKFTQSGTRSHEFDQDYHANETTYSRIGKRDDRLPSGLLKVWNHLANSMRHTGIEDKQKSSGVTDYIEGSKHIAKKDTTSFGGLHRVKTSFSSPDLSRLVWDDDEICEVKKKQFLGLPKKEYAS